MSRRLGRWNNDLNDLAKTCRREITGWRSIIGTVSDKLGNSAVNLIEKIRQGCGVTDIIRGQFRADDFSTDKIETKVKLAPSLAFDFDFVLAFQPFALTEDLQACADGPAPMAWLRASLRAIPALCPGATRWRNPARQSPRPSVSQGQTHRNRQVRIFRLATTRYNLRRRADH